jgi:cytochrome P450
MDDSGKRVPGPDGRMLLRYLRQIQQEPLAFLAQVTGGEYGDVVRFNVGMLDVYLVNHPEGVQRVLQDHHRNYSKNTFQYNLLELVTGNGLLTSDGGFWLRQRRLAQPAFHRSQLAGFGRTMVEAAGAMLERWRSLPSDKPLDIDGEMMRVTLEIVGETLFSMDLRGEASALAEAVLATLDYILYRSRVPFALPTAVPTGQNRRFKQALRRLDETVYGLIERRRQRPGEGNDLLAMLLQARDEETGEGMDDQQVRDEIMTLLIAGHETVASALTWTWYLLGQRPDVEARLYGEVQGVLGGRRPTMEDLPQLAYTRMVFDEALRLYPPAWILTRRAEAADVVNGYQIPAGALVVISPYTVHRHRKFWPEPEVFRPERFGEEEGNKRPRYAYIPFGGGPRLCIGNHFALMEGVLILATVVQQVRLVRPEGEAVRVVAGVTLRPGEGLPMCVEWRTAADRPGLKTQG